MSERQNTQEVGKKKKFVLGVYTKIALTAFITVAACILFFFAVLRREEMSAIWGNIKSAAEPVVFGLVLAYLLAPVKKFCEKHAKKLLEKKIKKEEKLRKWSKTLGIIGSLIFLLIVIAVLLAIIIPAVTSSIMGLAENFSGYIRSFMNWVDNSKIGALILGENSGEVASEQLITWLKGNLWPKVQEYLANFQDYFFHITNGVVSVLTTLINFIIGIIVMLYTMSVQDKLVAQAKKIVYASFEVKRANVIIKTARKSNEIFGGFIYGKIIDSAIIGVLCYIGCLILRIPSPLLVAVIVGVTNVVPFFGPLFGAIVTVPLVMIQSPIHGLYLAIFILLLQQLDGNLIGPMILGDTTGLSGFWVMFAILVCGGLFGFYGMLLGVPTVAVLYYIAQEILKARASRKNLPKKTEEYMGLVSINEETFVPEYKVEVPKAKRIKKKEKKQPEETQNP